ncbi:MAG: PspC domain-containing protein [Gammaproteobacteria bacterium]|nr:PspC domain-containing protein [Gammaproteobacteria bacterium]
MHRILHASLNHNPYPIEEDAYAHLETYLAESAIALANYPDRDEILLDLEQAIADQCRRRQPPQATAITLQELSSALEEMGPVRIDEPDSKRINENVTSAAPILFQQISQGAWICGVCLGIARYLRIDVTLIRGFAAALLLFSGGTSLLFYGVLAGIVPYAEIDPNGPPVSRIPAKLREWIEYLRGNIARLTR